MIKALNIPLCSCIQQLYIIPLLLTHFIFMFHFAHSVVHELLLHIICFSLQTFAHADKNYWQSVMDDWESEKQKILNSLLSGGRESLVFPVEAEVFVQLLLHFTIIFILLQAILVTFNFVSHWESLNWLHSLSNTIVNTVCEFKSIYSNFNSLY